jgi:hypothetical protein
LPALCEGGLQHCRKHEGDKRRDEMAVHRSTPSLLCGLSAQTSQSVASVLSGRLLARTGG